MDEKDYKKGAPSVRKTAELVWKRYWKDLPQKKIQDWIERIPRHIKEVIRQKGGNQYQEGKEDPVHMALRLLRIEKTSDLAVSLKIAPTYSFVFGVGRSSRGRDTTSAAARP